VRFHKKKRTRSTVEHTSAVAAKTKASSLISLIKKHSKILKLLQLKNFSSLMLIFEKRFGIEYTIFLITKQKTRFKIFGNIGYRYTNGLYICISLIKAILVDL